MEGFLGKKQYLVGDAHQAVLHVALHLGYQLDAIDEQFPEQLFRYVALVSDQQQRDFTLQLHEPAVRHGLREQVRPMPADEFKVEMLEATVSAHVEGDENGDDLGIRKAVGLVVVALPAGFLQSVVFHRFAVKLAEIVCQAINFRNFVL